MNLPKLLEQMRGRLAAATPGPWRHKRWAVPLSASVVGPNEERVCELHFHIEQKDPNGDFIANAPTDLAFALDALEIALGALESICIEGSERYENTADQVPRDHLVALLVVARGKAFWARTKINELAKARGE